MNHTINCCDLCGNVVSINNKETRRVWNIVIEVYAYSFSATDQRKRESKHVDIRKTVCDECHESMRPLGATAFQWLESRKDINAAKITVQEKVK